MIPAQDIISALSGGAQEAPADTTANAAAASDKGWGALESLSLSDLINRLAGSFTEFAVNLAIAILVFYVGKLIIRKLYTFTAGILYRRKVDKSLTTFVLSLVNMVLYFILIVTVIGILGINTSSFIAIFASAGVAIGMALSGTLQNFAGGVLILLLKPYKVGEYIEAQGYGGVVREIQIFSTIITTPDNKSITIPNGPLSTGSINNWSREKYRRIDWTVGISYGDSVDRAREVILGLLGDDSRIVTSESEEADTAAAEAEEMAAEEEASKSRGFLRNIFHKSRKNSLKNVDTSVPDINITAFAPKVKRDPVVLVAELADSSVNLTVRAWVKSSDYWDVYFTMNEQFYKAIPEAGLSFPFPQLDVHLPS